jgi:NRPS condensation-like uncharacterized protein
MTRAVRLSLDAEPVLGCRFVEGRWRPYWERRNDLDRVKLLHLTETADVEEVQMRFLTTPMDPCTDLLVQVEILRSGTDTLCIKMSHVVADGGGMKEYVDLLATIYRRLAEEPGHVVTPNLRGRRSLHQISNRFGFWDKLRIVRSGLQDMKRSNFPAPYWNFPFDEGGCPAEPKRAFVIRRLGPDRLPIIREYGHKQKATLNDVMLAAFCRVLHDLIKPEPDVHLRLRMFADLRRYLPAAKGEAICNLSGLVHLNIGTELGAAFDDTCVRVRDRMNVMRAGFPGLGDLSMAAIALKWFPFFLARKQFRFVLRQLIRSGNIPPILTNWGPIEPDRADFGDITVAHAFGAPPAVFPPFFSLTVTSFRETLTLCTGFLENAIERGKVEDLLDRLENELPGSDHEWQEEALLTRGERNGKKAAASVEHLS